MIDPLNLDQLRVFVSIAELGSFSAAAKKLYRAQSAISNAVLNLEKALGIDLFDRSGWRPQLTEQGKALLPDALDLLNRAERLRNRARHMAQGLEAELSIVLDVMFPNDQIVRLVTEFQQTFPSVNLRLCVDILGGVHERVISKKYDLGIQGSLPDIDPELTSISIQEVPLVAVAAPEHPLAFLKNITNDVLINQTQIVLTDSSDRTSGRTFSVMSENKILTTDLGSKREMLIAKLGWGFMPLSFVQKNLKYNELVELDLVSRKPRNKSMPLVAVYRNDSEPGLAKKWVLDWLLSQAK